MPLHMPPMAVDRLAKRPVGPALGCCMTVQENNTRGVCNQRQAVTNQKSDHTTVLSQPQSQVIQY